ncbi:zinc finger, MYND-type containing 10 [Trypanosoma rangeli]|uniref:Zinc finger, MYND-type containing 10 n=1 Tax=Trypanosoma rangeli TaxID=5698 RepID=A0A422P1Q9_TRYRA|nr:zinc finger, MYND-type containing 10 [Trypanosoma rangeli]RNF11614.1 zinc finger, MYND-type containing 10 [Trypanosoma rangeli]|eukprot:RNF11614.1 zinc finger, MYND-type containing 10 [Trypanosoma rangeli]
MEFSGSTLSVSDVEIMVQQLKPLSIEQVGTAEWKDERERVERLNMCSHSNAVLKKDDAVKAFLVEHEKLPVLLHELLVMEMWRHRVLPLVKDSVAGNPTAYYMFPYYEMVLANLFECISFHEEVVVALGDDVLELVDYCWRQVSRLFAESGINEVPTKLTPQQMGEEDSRQHLERQLSHGMVQRAMTSLSILWFIIDRLEQLPLSVSNAVFNKHDLVLGLSEIMLLQPWLRRGPGVTQKYCNGEFKDVSQEEALLVCIPEAHTWFSLHKMLCDPECRRRYPYTQSKKELILRIRRFLNDTLLDQMPALASVQRALEELSFMQPPSDTDAKLKRTLTIEQVPRIATAVEASRTRSWEDIANTFSALLKDPCIRNEDVMRMTRIFDEMFTE